MVSSDCTSWSKASVTASGVGMEGLPMEKSITFSLPTTFACWMPYSNSSRMQERLAPREYMALEII